MTITPIIRLFVAVCCLGAVGPALATDLEAVKADWKADLDRYDDVVAEFYTRTTDKRGGNVSTQENKCTVKKLGLNRLACLVEKTRTRLSVANEKYFFAAVEGKNGGWTLDVYGLLSDDQISKPLRRLDGIASNLDAHYSIGEIPLYENLDAFRVTAETEDVLTLNSTRDLESQASVNKVRMYDICMHLDKKNRYRLLDVKCQQHVNQSSGNLSAFYKTDRSAGDSEHITITTTATYDTGPSEIVIESTVQYKFQFLAGLKDTDFRLTAYGFAEPSGVVWQKPTPVYLWLLAGAGGFALLALLLAYLKRQSGRHAQPGRELA